MKTAYDLMLSAPAAQVVRCKLVYNAILQGEWADAAFTLKSAARETGGEFGADCMALAIHCEDMAHGQ